MTNDAQFQRLRMERNLALIAAVLFIAISMAVSVPRALGNRRELISANNDLLIYQATIVATHQMTNDTQREILQIQQEITNLLQAHH